MNISVNYKREESIDLDEDQVKEITIRQLKNMICSQEADKFFIENGKLMRRDDYGHHRGGKIDEEIREATKLDKAIILVLNKLDKK